MLRIFFVASLLIAFTARAEQSFKIIKIQGKRAVVEMSDPSSVSLNQSYNVGSSSVSTKSSFRREYGIAANFSYFNQTTAPTSTQLTLGGQFLWNMKQYEAGPILQYLSTSSGGFNTSSTSFGAIGYYNFVENKVGVEGIPSAVAQVTQSSGSGSSATSIALGANYRWFVLSGDHCFSFGALYTTTQSSGASVSGIVLNGGIATYF